MQLIYHRGQNFGDTLNKYVFEGLYPGCWNNDEIEFWGIGSILGLKKPQAETKKIFVFSSGYAPEMPGTYGAPPDLSDSRFDVRAVRGPISSSYLPRNKQTKQFGDAGLLISEVVSPATVRSGVGLMPHISTERRFPGIKHLCEELNIQYLSPSIEGNIGAKKISSLDLLISEAMHGAIVADAYDIPRINVTFSRDINLHKWQDYHRGLHADSPDFHHIRPSMFQNDALDKLLQSKGLRQFSSAFQWYFNQGVYRYVSFQLKSILKSWNDDQLETPSLAGLTTSTQHRLISTMDELIKDFRAII